MRIMDFQNSFFWNEAGLDLSDYLDYLANDKDTDVITMYLEGIKNGRKFLKVNLGFLKLNRYCLKIWEK